MNFVIADMLSIVGSAFLFALPPAESQTANTGGAATSLASLGKPLKIGESFLRARSRIISAGWTPVRTHQDDGYEFSGAEKELVEKHVLEVDTCSVDAGVLCIFYYKKQDKCLRLDTLGEDVRNMTVRRWAEECPVRDR